MSLWLCPVEEQIWGQIWDRGFFTLAVPTERADLGTEGLPLWPCPWRDRLGTDLGTEGLLLPGSGRIVPREGGTHGRRGWPGGTAGDRGWPWDWPGARQG